MIIKRLAFEPVLTKHLEALGIDHRVVTMSPDFHKLDRQQRLYRLASFAFRMTGDALLGLKIARKVPLNAFGALAHAFLSAPSLGHFLQISVRHMRIFQAGTRNAASLSNGRGRVYLNYDHPIWLAELPSFVPDLLFAANLQAIRQLAGDDLDDRLRLELTYQPPDKFQYQAEVGIPVEFNARRNRLSVPVDVARRPLPSSFLTSLEPSSPAGREYPWRNENKRGNSTTRYRSNFSVSEFFSHRARRRADTGSLRAIVAKAIAFSRYEFFRTGG